MPTVSLGYKTLKEGTGQSDERLQERMCMLGTSVEEFTKERILVEVPPSRPDLLSEYGYLRALRSFIGLTKGLLSYPTRGSGKRVIIHPSLKGIRPCTACAIVTGLNLDEAKIEQLIQLQEKLHQGYCRNRSKAAIGIYPSHRLKYPIEFFAENPKKIRFKPLGASREMNGLEILTSHPTGREYAKLLEGKPLFPFFRDAAGEILSMPPIINSEFTGRLEPGTREVFVECSGHDLNFLSRVLNIILYEMADMGGQIQSMDLEYPAMSVRMPQLDPIKMRLDEEYVYGLLGVKVNIKSCLERMGYSYSKGIVLVPSYRVDVLHPIDLVEDIAIAHGYENFKPELPSIATTALGLPIEGFKERVGELLVGLGLIGVVTLNVSNPKVQQALMGVKTPVIEFSNFKSMEYSALRNSMLPGLLEVLQRNAKNEYPQKIFDMGTVFRFDAKQETGVREEEWLGVALCGSEEDFTRVKQALEYLLSAFGLEGEYEWLEHPSFIQGRAASLRVRGREFGILGEISPRVLENFKLEMPVAVFEINLETLQELAG